MENEDTEYKEGNGNEFTEFLFSSEPKALNTVKLELSPGKKDVKIGLHIFQELLMIFTEGIKYLFLKDNKINISDLTINDINLMEKYFNSFGFKISLEKFTIAEYLSNMKLPNYFLNQELIKDNTPLPDIYYETRLDNNDNNVINIYRISFDFLR